MQDTPRRVYVTGAGFTRAFVPKAPLLVDDFDNDELVLKVRGLPKASELLELERNKHPDGFINIERLMTRLDDLMPYDYANETIDEYAYLLAELKRAFRNRLARSRIGEVEGDDLQSFANYSSREGNTCITFNYDDYLDQALLGTDVWNPYWGYGFFCQSAAAIVKLADRNPLRSTISLLKLHGSMNWRARLGYSKPYALDAVVHFQEWEGTENLVYPPDVISQHLEREPVMVPPVLSKTTLVSQPILRLVWSHAYCQLQAAEHVTFIGYSLPPTDGAARILFTEPLVDLPKTDVQVVELANTEEKKNEVKSRYRLLYPDLPDSAFFFGGARDWVRTLGDQHS